MMETALVKRLVRVLVVFTSIGIFATGVAGAAADTTLKLSPSAASQSVGDTFTVSVEIDTGVNEVLGVEHHISFDATELTAEEIIPGTFFDSFEDTTPVISNTLGTIDYTITVPAGVSGQSGKGTVAVITFVAEQAGTSTISFDSDTVVAATGESGKSALSSTLPANITISSSGAVGGGAPPAATTSGTLPDAGIASPTIMAFGIGIILLMGSLLLAL